MFKNLSSQAALALALATAPVAVLAAPWATEPAQAASQAGRSSYDGVVEALRQTVVAAQVPGAVVELAVKAGDTVQAGQLLLRIDARSADQSAAAVDAQVQAARAQLDVATREYERQKQLFAKKYISQAALECRGRGACRPRPGQRANRPGGRRAHANRPARGARALCRRGGRGACGPGRHGHARTPLLTLYDPAQLRVTAAVPQSALPAGAKPEDVRVELAGQGAQTTPQRVQVLPTVPATHTVQVRADLPQAWPVPAQGCLHACGCPVRRARARARASPCRRAPWCAAPS
jgi:multidrug efflux pump subunit AcrA (membrane-fusion protein)